MDSKEQLCGESCVIGLRGLEGWPKLQGKAGVTEIRSPLAGRMLFLSLHLLGPPTA